MTAQTYAVIEVRREWEVETEHLGSKHADYHKLRTSTARSADDDDDEIAQAFPTDEDPDDGEDVVVVPDEVSAA